MPTLQEQLAAQGISMADAPATMPMPTMGTSMPPMAMPSGPATLNMPVQSIGPQGLQPSSIAPPSGLRAALAKPGPSAVDANVDLSQMNGGPIGPLDLGLARRPSAPGSGAAHGPDLNVDYSQIEPSVGYKPAPAAPSLRQAFGGGAAHARNPFANEEAALGESKKGMKTSLDLQQELGEQRSMLGFQQQDMATARAGDLALKRDADSQALKGNEETYAKANEELSHHKVDSNRLWNNMSTGQKVMGFVSLALGGFLQGFNHLQSNPAMDQMNEAIRRDIDEQKANIEGSKAKLSGIAETRKMMLQRFGNEDAADAATHAAMLEKVKSEGDVIAAQQRNADAQQDWQAQTGQIDVHIAQLKDRAAQFATQGAARPPKLEENRLVRDPTTGKSYYAPTEKQQEAYTKQTQKLSQYDKLAGELVELRKDPTNLISPTKRAEMEAKGAQLAILTKDINDLGAITKNDIGLMPTPPDIATSIMPGTSARIEEARKIAKGSLRTTFAGLPEVQAGFAQDPRTGQTVRTGQLTGRTYDDSSLREKLATPPPASFEGAK